MEDKQVTTKKRADISLYTDPSIGTENITTEDINTPVLKILQPTTQGIDNKKDGVYYRSDTKQQYEGVDVNLVYVTTTQVENYNKTGIEKVKMYYGFYFGTNEPFRMYIRGWGLAAHRDFQTEVMGIKNKLKIPMLALTIQLTTEKQSGTIADTGKPYTIYKPVFNVVKDKDNNPLIESDNQRVKFLVESAARFANISTPSINDVAQNVNPEDIPF